MKMNGLKGVLQGLETGNRKMMRLASKLEGSVKWKPRLSNVRFISQLFVSRLSFYTSDDEFRQLFLPFGQVKEARLVMDPKTGRNKGFGFVTFENEAEAQNAVNAMNARIVKGRIIFVEYANKIEE